MRRRERGQSTVELVVALPTLLLVLLVVLQSALYVHALQVVRAVAQEAARAAAADGASLADGQSRARALLQAGLGQSGQLLNVRLSEDAQGVQAAVSGSMGLLTEGPVQAFGLPIQASARATREVFVPSGGGT
ncbi:MAG: pilus assembly protein [Chloroflexota bacterium]|nr:pilus assembly protein [Chloroflexota bacterium]